VIYQFIPNAPVRVMERLICSMVPGTMAILDLEDRYLDVRDPAATSERREEAKRQGTCGEALHLGSGCRGCI
jgi:hypothetical protein